MQQRTVLFLKRCAASVTYSSATSEGEERENPRVFGCSVARASSHHSVLAASGRTCYPESQPKLTVRNCFFVNSCWSAIEPQSGR